jgi:hypothetical protein
MASIAFTISGPGTAADGPGAPTPAQVSAANRAAQARERTRARPGTGHTKQLTPKGLKTLQDAANVKAAQEVDKRDQSFRWGPVPVTRQWCLAQTEALIHQLHPYGVASTMTRDTTALPTEPSTLRLLSHRLQDWTTVTNWNTLLTAVAQPKTGGAAPVVVHRLGAIGHAFTIVNTTSGQYIADAQVRPGSGAANLDVLGAGGDQLGRGDLQNVAERGQHGQRQPFGGAGDQACAGPM